MQFLYRLIAAVSAIFFLGLATVSPAAAAEEDNTPTGDPRVSVVDCLQVIEQQQAQPAARAAACASVELDQLNAFVEFDEGENLVAWQPHVDCSGMTYIPVATRSGEAATITVSTNRQWDLQVDTRDQFIVYQVELGLETGLHTFQYFDRVGEVKASFLMQASCVMAVESTETIDARCQRAIAELLSDGTPIPSELVDECMDAMPQMYPPVRVVGGVQLCMAPLSMEVRGAAGAEFRIGVRSEGAFSYTERVFRLGEGPGEVQETVTFELPNELSNGDVVGLVDRADNPITLMDPDDSPRFTVQCEEPWTRIFDSWYVIPVVVILALLLFRVLRII